MDVFTVCETFVRDADKDRFIATLFAPADRRGPLSALYAFDAEVAGVRNKIREPLAGEVRLRWWHDVIGGAGEGGGNPVAVALLDAVRRYELPLQPLLALIEAHRVDLYAETRATIIEFESYAAETSSAIVELAMGILGRPDASARAVARSAGVALAITRILRSFPFDVARGKVYLPEELLRRHDLERAELLDRQSSAGLRGALADLRSRARRHLDELREPLGALPDRFIPALLPVAVVRAHLARMERADYEPFQTLVEVPQWRRQWRVWRAARDPRRIAGDERA